MNLTLVPRESSSTACRVCAAPCHAYGRYAGAPGMPELDLVICDQCSSLSYVGEDPVIGYTRGRTDPVYWRHYCQRGAGISSMLEPLHSVDKTGDLLDVGCGFGYVVDYWRRSGRGDACGMELAEYGKVGKDKLGVEIHHALLGECEAIDKRLFDVVYSSEVIEHTRDPLAFCIALRERCKADGVVVLTTPSNRAILGDHPHSTRIAALSPYFHYFVASKSGMEGLLRRAGFSDILVIDAGTRLFVWASMSKLPEITRQQVDWASYYRYLWQLADNPDEHISSGALHRIVKNAWNQGDFDQSARAFARLERLAADAFGIRLREPRLDALISGMMQRDLLVAPAWTCLGLFFGAMLQVRDGGDRMQALQMADVAEKLMRVEMETWQLRPYSQDAELYHPRVTAWIFDQLCELRDSWAEKIRAPGNRSFLKRCRTAVRAWLIRQMVRQTARLQKKIR